MRIALQLTAPYGMVFQQVQSMVNPAQIDLYLIHDSSDIPSVIAWLDKTKETYIAQQEQQRLALEAAQQPQHGQSVSVGIPGNMALAERLALESKAANEKLFGGPDAPPPQPAPRPPVHNERPMPAPAVQPPLPVRMKQVPKAVHDWGGPYKLGNTCRKCGEKATGFEPACPQ